MTHKPLSAAEVTARVMERIQSAGEDVLAEYQRRYGSVLKCRQRR